ncbi:MAG: hypothetical protein ACI3XX_01885 [Eubacteriales bacterium]
MNEIKGYKTHDKLRKVLYWIVMSSFIVSLIYVPLRVIFDEYYRTHTQYGLMIFQCVLGMVVINLPNILTKKLKWHIPTLFYVLYMLFLYLSIFVGEVAKFYYKVHLWDDLLHLSSSMMLAMLGFSLVDILNEKNTYVKLSPFFVSLFACTFSLSMGAIWEIFEFTFDHFLGFNMQKYAVESSDGVTILSDLVGHAALSDTMTDIIIDFTGAVVISVIGYISVKRKKNWLNAFLLKTKTDSLGDEQDENQVKIEAAVK